MLGTVTDATDATDTNMRLLGKDCGCDSRRDIIFNAGDVGLPEAIILVLAATGLIAALVFAKGGTNAPVG